MEISGEYLSAAGLNSALQRTTRDRVKKEAVERRRNVLYLVLAYLRDQGLTASADTLATEAQLTGEHEVCDNVDLDTVLQEYQSYYAAKFGRSVKILRQTMFVTKTSTVANQRQSASKRRSNTAVTSQTDDKKDAAVSEENGFRFEVRRLGRVPDETDHLPKECRERKVIKLPESYSGEWKDLGEAVLREVLSLDALGSGPVWDDCVGLHGPVECLKEALVYPRLYPNLFKGLAAPWRGILLYGPPGTGKTLLARATACRVDGDAFFNVTSGAFVNKWRGDSEKMLRILFQLARLHAPSTIFVDELDSLACGSGGAFTSPDVQHDASRRFRSELLVQLDGIIGSCNQDGDHDGVFVLATTNRPWDLDAAVLRRFEKRILVDLPDEQTRARIFEHFLSGTNDTFGSSDYDEMARESSSFSGCDVRLACREASMKVARDSVSKLVKGQVRQRDLLQKGPTLEDVTKSVGSIRPVTDSKTRERYLKWQREFGSV